MLVYHRHLRVRIFVATIFALWPRANTYLSIGLYPRSVFWLWRVAATIGRGAIMGHHWHLDVSAWGLDAFGQQHALSVDFWRQY